MKYLGSSQVSVNFLFCKLSVKHGFIKSIFYKKHFHPMRVLFILSMLFLAWDDV